jgi:hypothetical protein
LRDLRAVVAFKLVEFLPDIEDLHTPTAHTTEDAPDKHTVSVASIAVVVEKVVDNRAVVPRLGGL